MGQKIDLQPTQNKGVHESGAAGIQIIAAQFAQINYLLGRSLLSVATATIMETWGGASLRKHPEKYEGGLIP